MDMEPAPAPGMHVPAPVPPPSAHAPPEAAPPPSAGASTAAAIVLILLGAASAAYNGWDLGLLAGDLAIFDRAGIGTVGSALVAIDLALVGARDLMAGVSTGAWIMLLVSTSGSVLAAGLLLSAPSRGRESTRTDPSAED